jgi:hypothetical protein
MSEANDRYWYSSIFVNAGNSFNVIEMKPRWLDDTTLQLAVTMFGPQMRYDNLTTTTAARAACLKASCSSFAEALQWTRDHRMGCKVEHLQLVSVPVTLMRKTEDRAAAGENGANALLHYLKRARNKNGMPRKRASEQPVILFSHRLTFKTMQNAFHFELRWR